MDKDAIICENWQQLLQQRVNNGDVAIQSAPAQNNTISTDRATTVTQEGATENTEKKKIMNDFYKNLMEKGKNNKDGAPG